MGKLEIFLGMFFVYQYPEPHSHHEKEKEEPRKRKGGIHFAHNMSFIGNGSPPSWERSVDTAFDSGDFIQ